MQLKPLDFSALSEIYNTIAVNDFPKDELKPFANIERLYRNDMYKALGLYSGDTLCAYSLLLIPSEFSQPLLDYYAVCSDLRGKGFGSKCLTLLQQYFRDISCIVFEVESPEAALNENDRQMRENRIRFYRNNGAVMTDVRTLVYGVHYSIMYLPCGGDIPDIRNHIAGCYRDMLGTEKFKKHFSFI